MQYLKKELNKILPLALLFGAIGGVLLIACTNLFTPGKFGVFTVYLFVICLSVYVLNRLRFKKEVKSSVLYGYCVYAVMTLIAYVDVIMNANPDFVNPVFENGMLFAGILATVMLLAFLVTYLFKKQIIR
ncbi:MAG: hypothetical protein WDZ35_01160 [Crocinitomicaceae bacterium]